MELSYIAEGNVKCLNYAEKLHAELKIHLPSDSKNLPEDNYPSEIDVYFHKNTCIRMFRISLFITVNFHQVQCSSR